MATLPVPALAPAVIPTPDLHDFKWGLRYSRRTTVSAGDRRRTHTIVDWKNFCRDICLEYFTRNPVVIGGPGQTVEIDECLLVCRIQEVQRRIST